MSVGRVTDFQHYFLSLLLPCNVFAKISEVSILLKDGLDVGSLMLAFMHSCEIVDDREAADFVLVFKCFLCVISPFKQAVLDCIFYEPVEASTHFYFLYGLYVFI